MQLVDSDGIWKKILERSLQAKRIRKLSREELVYLISIGLDHVRGEGEDSPNGVDHAYGYRMPHYHGNGVLIVPWNAPKRFRYWEILESPPKERYQILQKMGVPQSDIHFFMHEADINEALREENAVRPNESGNKTEIES